ncbi:MAG: spermidine/putrescine ABC transporter substrate-binding protein [Ruminococcaceae bacterium]|nr:spermidine/putrescine ABC transporter substrate-binding protein [Oscillospiraceae bacterium]
MKCNIIKRISALLLTILCLLPSLLFCLSGCAAEGIGSDTVTLYVYNWGEYISDGSEGCLDSNAVFEDWYYDTYGVRVKVNYSTFSSNESLYAKLSSGSVSYDVVVPSDYMIERLISEDLLAPLNYDNIPLAKENLLPEFFGETSEHSAYDPGNVYSVPYLYGMIGIIYNTTMVEADDPGLGSWKLMWDENHAGNILQFNNSRDAFGTAQYFLGIDVNSDDEAEWRSALDKLREQKPILQGYVMDEIYNKMENGSAGIAAYYAGDYLAMYENNPDLEFFYPKEGTNLYVDAMCVPKSAKNKEIAERYINFMLSVDPTYGAPAIANAEYTYYASPNQKVVDDESYIEYMSEIKEDAYEKMYDTDAVQTSTYKNLSGEKLMLINRLWEELKSDVTVSAGIYVICGIIVTVLLGLFIFFAVRKKIRNIY